VSLVGEIKAKSFLQIAAGEKKKIRQQYMRLSMRACSENEDGSSECDNDEALFSSEYIYHCDIQMYLCKK